MGMVRLDCGVDWYIWENRDVVSRLVMNVWFWGVCGGVFGL